MSGTREKPQLKAAGFLQWVRIEFSATTHKAQEKQKQHLRRSLGNTNT